LFENQDQAFIRSLSPNPKSMYLWLFLRPLSRQQHWQH